jgi:hypothetical protein
MDHRSDNRTAAFPKSPDSGAGPTARSKKKQLAIAAAS